RTSRGLAQRAATRQRPHRLQSAVAVVAIAVLPLAALTALLRFDTQSGDRPRLEALDADLLSCLEAVAVRAVLDPLDRFVDLADELALPVARAQLEAEFLFLRRSIVGVREVRRFILHMGDRTVHLDHQVALPAIEDVAEVLALLLAHVLLATLGDIRLY